MNKHPVMVEVNHSAPPRCIFCGSCAGTERALAVDDVPCAGRRAVCKNRQQFPNQQQQDGHAHKKRMDSWDSGRDYHAGQMTMSTPTEGCGASVQAEQLSCSLAECE